MHIANATSALCSVRHASTNEYGDHHGKNKAEPNHNKYRRIEAVQICGCQAQADQAEKNVKDH